MGRSRLSHGADAKVSIRAFVRSEDLLKARGTIAATIRARLVVLRWVSRVVGNWGAARFLAVSLATAGCGPSVERTSHAPGCDAVRLRTRGGPEAWEIAAVGDTLWASNGSTLSQVDAKGRVLRRFDLAAPFSGMSPPQVVAMVGSGDRLGMLVRFEDAEPAFLSLDGEGRALINRDLGYEGVLTPVPGGSFALIDEFDIRFVDGKTVTVQEGSSLAPDESVEHSWLVAAATASGFVVASAWTTDDGAAHLVVRWLDSEGRAVGERVVLDTPPPEILMYTLLIRPWLTAAGDRAVLIYTDGDGKKLATIGPPGEFDGPRPFAPGIWLHIEDVETSDEAIWVAGVTAFRGGKWMHDYRHRKRLHLLRLDLDGKVVAHARLATPSGSTFRPRLAVRPGGDVVGIYAREPVGRLNNRRDTIHARWLSGRCD